MHCRLLVVRQFTIAIAFSVLGVVTVSLATNDDTYLPVSRAYHRSGKVIPKILRSPVVLLLKQDFFSGWMPFLMYNQHCEVICLPIKSQV